MTDPELLTKRLAVNVVPDVVANRLGDLLAFANAMRERIT